MSTVEVQSLWKGTRVGTVKGLPITWFDDLILYINWYPKNERIREITVED